MRGGNQVDPAEWNLLVVFHDRRDLAVTADRDPRCRSGNLNRRPGCAEYSQSLIHGDQFAVTVSVKLAIAGQVLILVVGDAEESFAGKPNVVLLPRLLQRTGSMVRRDSVNGQGTGFILPVAMHSSRDVLTEIFGLEHLKSGDVPLEAGCRGIREVVRDHVLSNGLDVRAVRGKVNSVDHLTVPSVDD